MMTDKEIAKAVRDAKKSGDDVWLTDASKARGVGRLRLRATPAGVCLFYFRYSDSRGKQDTIPLGSYDRSGKAGLTLKDARAKAGALSKLYQAGQHDLRAYLEHQQAEESARMQTAAKARAEAERQATSGAFHNLCDAYVAHLKRQGKQSCADVRNIFRRNVIDEFPHLAAMKASDITHKDVSVILARMIDRGVGRNTSKCRSYLNAAWVAAIGAEGDPMAHPSLLGFDLTSNPVALVSARKLSVFNRARDRALNETEVHCFLNKLDKRTGIAADAIRLNMHLGGQRAAQLVRVKPQDVDVTAKEVKLLDAKGARKEPRVHRLPLTERAMEIVMRLLAQNGDRPFLITIDGRVPTRTETLSKVVTEISGEMVEEGIAREPFGMRDLRRTVETHMARLGITKEVRAHVLSHGLSGVQARHYDRHDYAQEKRHALEVWARELERIKTGAQHTRVVPIARARR